MAIGFEDYYATLGVGRTASADEIQQAYRKLARKYHPDVNKAAEAGPMFKKVAEAYEVLKDADKRSRYDTLGAQWKQGDSFGNAGGPDAANGAGVRGRSRSRKRSGSAPATENPFGGNFSDFFSSMFNDQGGNGGSAGGFGGSGSPFADRGGQAQQSPSPETTRPREPKIEITVALREAVLGATRTVSLRYPDGASRSHEVHIKPGTRSGDLIRLIGEGFASPSSSLSPGGMPGPTGDLLIAIIVAPDPRFRVEGGDLVSTITLTPWEACLGAKVNVPLIDGDTATVNVPPGVVSGKRLRIKGRGVPLQAAQSAGSPASTSLKADERSPAGDLMLEIVIAAPSELTDRERRLVEELAAISNFRPRN